MEEYTIGRATRQGQDKTDVSKNNSRSSVVKAIRSLNASTQKVHQTISNVNNEIQSIQSPTNTNNSNDSDGDGVLDEQQMHQNVNKMKKRIQQMSELVNQTKNEIRVEEVNRTKLMKVCTPLDS